MQSTTLPSPFLKRHPWPLTLVLTGGTLAWDLSGLDQTAMHWLADGGGFALRHHWLLERVLHDGVHDLALAAYLAMLLMVWRPLGALRRLTGWQRLEIACGISLGLVLVGLFKGLSRTSCPWEVAEFGGLVPYVSHWAWNLADGGPGHCFPGGHASSAYAFLAVGLPWLEGNPDQQRLGRALLRSVLLTGLLLGLAQTLRGAHYPSHTWWTALVCWLGALANRAGFSHWRTSARRHTSETA